MIKIIFGPYEYVFVKLGSTHHYKFPDLEDKTQVYKFDLENTTGTLTTQQ